MKDRIWETPIEVDLVFRVELKYSIRYRVSRLKHTTSVRNSFFEHCVYWKVFLDSKRYFYYKLPQIPFWKNQPLKIKKSDRKKKKAQEREQEKGRNREREKERKRERKREEKNREKGDEGDKREKRRKKKELKNWRKRGKDLGAR